MKLREKIGRENGLGGWRGVKRQACSRARKKVHWVLCLRGFYLGVSGEDLNRTFISFPDVCFQGLGLY